MKMMSSDFEFGQDLEAQEEDLARKNRAQRRRNILIWCLAVLATAFAVVCLYLALDNSRLASSNAAFAEQQQGEKKEIAKEAQQALCQEGDRVIFDRELCDKWADAAGEPPIAPSVPAAIGGPSQADLVNAFREYCADGNCRGRDGQPPTPDDIAAAFSRFCADGRCTGSKGADGKDGQSVTPEMVLAAVTGYCSTGVCVGSRGADGAPPTAEAIFAAVQQYCANDACRGADSTVPGPGGPQGEPGRGISDTQCQDNGIWRITYTDGTIDNDAGQCRPDPIKPPLGGIL